ELLLDLVDLVVQGDDLFLDVEDLRVALRRDLVDFVEVLVGPFDLLVQFPDALVDVPALPCERVRLLLDLGFLLVGLRRVRPDLLQRLLRCLDSVRRAGPLDPQAIELFLELLRLLPARIRSRLSSESLCFLSAWRLSSSSCVMRAVLSRIRRRSTEDMETIRWMSPCWARLYPSAEIRAWARRESNSDREDFRSLM